MTSFEEELVRIGKELADEYLSDETIKQMVTENPENLDELIQKDVEENLEMRRGDLEFSHASFYDKEFFEICVKVPIGYEIISNPEAVQKLFFRKIPDALRKWGMKIKEMNFKMPGDTFYKEFPLVKIYATIPNPREDALTVGYKHKEADSSGIPKVQIFYAPGMERYVDRIAKMIGAKTGSLQISQKD